MTSAALLIVRVTVGALLAGHGAQKLFGSFGGHGLERTGGWLETMGLRPGRAWAAVAGWSEFGGGLLTALGALNPVGPVLGFASMLMATFKPHRGKPIWVTSGGAELPVTNMAALAAVSIAGPGRLSLDGLLGIRLPRWLGWAAFLSMVGTVGYVVSTSEGAPERSTGEAGDAGGPTRTRPAGGRRGRSRRSRDAAEGDRSAGSPSDRPGVESWGSPDPGEPAEQRGETARAGRR